MKQEHPQTPPPYYYQDDEITLKELILKIQEFWRELWKKKIWIILAGLIGAGLFVARAWMQETTYSAGLSFMVTENDQNDQGAYLNLDGQIELRGIGNNKITELARSGRIIHEVLLNQDIIGNTKDFIANHLISLYGFDAKWDKEKVVDQYKDLHLKDFQFTRSDIDQFSPKELRALSIVHDLVSGNSITGKKGLATTTFNEDTEVFRLKVTTLDENLSMRVIEGIYQELQAFYIEDKIGGPQRAFEILSVETDSLLQVLSSAEVSLARTKDRNRGVSSSISQIGLGKLERDVTRLNQEYEQAVRSKKRLEVLLQGGTPTFQVIDQTFFPLVNSSSRMKAIITGGFLGVFIGVIFYLGRKIIRDAMFE